MKKIVLVFLLIFIATVLIACPEKNGGTVIDEITGPSVVNVVAEPDEEEGGGQASCDISYSWDESVEECLYDCDTGYTWHDNSAGGICLDTLCSRWANTKWDGTACVDDGCGSYERWDYDDGNSRCVVTSGTPYS